MYIHKTMYNVLTLTALVKKIESNLQSMYIQDYRINTTLIWMILFC